MLARKDSVGTGRDSDDLTALDPNSPSTTSTFIITPKPAWVVKVLRLNGEKIFVNLTEHPDIPMMQLALNLGYNKWPFMIMTPARTRTEDKGGDEGGEISIYDAVVNPAVVQICTKDPQAKDAVSLIFFSPCRHNQLNEFVWSLDLSSHYALIEEKVRRGLTIGV